MIRSLSGNRNSFNKPSVPEKMTHGEAAHKITVIVEAHRGNQEKIDDLCRKVRETYFKQYRIV